MRDLREGLEEKRRRMIGTTEILANRVKFVSRPEI